MLVVRNYALAVIFITPLALTIASGGQRVTDVGGLLLSRGLETTLGCAVALTVFVLTTRRYDATRLRKALAATLETAATVCDHLQSGTATSPGARTARRDLQIGAMSMLAAYNAALLGPSTARRAAENMWPAIAAAERLAYRELAECWATEHPGTSTACTSLASDDSSSSLRQLAGAVRSGTPPPPLGDVPAKVADDLAAIRSSLQG
jgi:uncharacterized membrane protein YccC